MTLALSIVSAVGLTFLEPMALAGFAAPLLLLALGLRRRATRDAFLGTTRFFTDETSGDEGQRRRSLPVWLLLAAASLSLGVLALAQPGFEEEPPQGVVVEVVVDRSPSMFLPHLGANQGTGAPKGARRIDAAWERLLAWARSLEESIPGKVFLTVAGSGPVPFEKARLPEAPETAEREVVWLAHDGPSKVWVTDCAAACEGRQGAGLFASGGEAVPGLVSLGAAGGIHWNADGTTEFRADVVSDERLRLGPGVPELVSELARLWADARGVRVEDASRSDGDGEGSPSGGGPVVLSLERASRSGALEGTSSVERSGAVRAGRDGWAVRAGRDGWEANLLAPRKGASKFVLGGSSVPWLSDARGEPLVAWSPGRVELGFDGLEGEPTDTAAFAVSWIGLFDRARRAPSAVVEAAERRAAGPAVSAPPAEPAILESLGAAAIRDRQSERAAALRALLAAAAAMVGLGSLIALLRG